MSFASETNYSTSNNAAASSPLIGNNSPMKSSPLPLGKRKITVILKNAIFSSPQGKEDPCAHQQSEPPTPDSPPISPVKKMIKIFENEKPSLPVRLSVPISPTKIKSPEPIIKWRVRKVVRGNTEIIDPTPPASVKKMIEEGAIESAIYRFKDSVSGRRYGGSVFATEKNTLIERMNGYKKELNSEGKKKRHIANAVRKSPEDFEVGVVQVYQSDISESELHEEEEKYIVEHGTLNPKYGFNKSLPTDEPLRANKSRRNLSSEVLEAQRAFRKPSLTMLPPPRQSQPRASAEQAKASIHEQLSGEDLAEI